MIKDITLNDLRTMTKQEGLILQGCGGEPQEWLDELNNWLTDEGILLNGGQFREVSVFDNDGCTIILFHMDDVQLDIGKLAMWRLQTRQEFGSMWLSDYLPNRLGVHESGAPQTSEPAKPEAPIIGQDGNVFNLIGIAARALRENGLADQAKEMSERAFASGDYNQALGVLMEYVNPVSADDGMDEDEDWCREPEYDDEEEWDQGMGGMGGMS